MSTTIAMPSAIESAIKTMCEDAIGQSVRLLSSKYGFDHEEAMREVSVNLATASGKAPSRASPSATASAKGGKKAAMSADAKPKAKRGPTGYLLYTKQLRPEVKAELESNPDNAGIKVKPTDVVTALAARWKALSEEDRTYWNAKAKSDAEISDEDQDTGAATSEALHDPATKTPAKPSEGFTSHDGWVPAEPLVGHDVSAPSTKLLTQTTKKESAAESAKKRQSGYLLFGKEMRSQIKKSMEAELTEGEKLKPQAVVGEIAAQWKALSEDDRATWNDKAKTPPTSEDGSD